MQQSVVDNQLAVEPQPVHRSIEANLITAGFEGSKKSAPSNGEFFHAGRRSDGRRIRMRKLQIDSAVHPRNLWRARKVTASEVFGVDPGLAIVSRQHNTWNDGLLAQKIHSRMEGDFRGSKLRADSCKSGRRARRGSGIVAVEHTDRFSERAEYCNLLNVGTQRQGTIIFQQHHRFPRRLERQRTVCVTVDLRFRRLRIFHHLGWIEHSQAKTGGEQALQRSIDFFFGEQALFYGVDISNVIRVGGGDRKEIRAIVVHPGLYCVGGGFGHALCEVVSAENVYNCVAIGNHVAIKFPGAAQLIFQQERVCASRLAVDAVVSAHNRLGLAFRDRCAKRRQVSVFHVVLRYLHVHAMPRCFRSAVHGKMFRRGNHAKIFWIVTLQSGDKRHSHSSGEKRILAVGFLAAAPPRIAKNIYVRGPEVEPLHNVAPSCAHRLIMFGARFGANHFGHVMDQRNVKRRREANRLGKYCSRARPGHSVQCLTPPVVCRNLQARDCTRLVYQLRCFLLEGHLPYQIVNPLTGRSRRIKINPQGCIVGGLRNGSGCCYKEHGHKQHGLRPAGSGHDGLSLRHFS